MCNSRMMYGICTLIIISLLAGACGSRVSEGMAPRWYLNPPDSKDKIYGTGASEVTSSLELGKQVADSNARTALASTIQVSVQSMVRTFLQQSGDMENTRTLQFSEAVAKNVVDVKLSGVTIDRRDVRGGRCFSLAVIDRDSMRNALLSAVRDAAAEYSEQKAKSAFQDLEKDIRGGKEIPIVKP
ncbi:LPP20 family lipoprotein [Candidatus Latescibacterota bacterium]